MYNLAGIKPPVRESTISPVTVAARTCTASVSNRATVSKRIARVNRLNIGREYEKPCRAGKLHGFQGCDSRAPNGGGMADGNGVRETFGVREACFRFPALNQKDGPSRKGTFSRSGREKAQRRIWDSGFGIWDF